MSPNAPKKPKAARPLNKKEQRLFARVYLGSLALSSTDNISHTQGLTESEAEGISEIIDEMAAKILGEHDAQGDAQGILSMIKSKRK